MWQYVRNLFQWLPFSTVQVFPPFASCLDTSRCNVLFSDLCTTHYRYLSSDRRVLCRKETPAPAISYALFIRETWHARSYFNHLHLYSARAHSMVHFHSTILCKLPPLPWFLNRPVLSKAVLPIFIFPLPFVVAPGRHFGRRNWRTMLHLLYPINNR